MGHPSMSAGIEPKIGVKNARIWGVFLWSSPALQNYDNRAEQTGVESKM
jgi:hypothetical protein